MNEKAFPNPHLRDGSGMTIRDVYAGLAMQGIIATKGWHPDFTYPTDFNFDAGKRAADAVAVAAYNYADAMLKERAE